MAGVAKNNKPVGRFAWNEVKASSEYKTVKEMIAICRDMRIATMHNASYTSLLVLCDRKTFNEKLLPMFKKEQ